MDMQYIKTDRNGTKYYHDWQCPHCGGAGSSDNWAYTGKTCWVCGGTGKRSTPRVVKVYTEEYRAKLDAKAKARQEAKEADAKAAGYTAIMGRYGFNENGIAYVYVGNTYKIKEDLKEHGARWNFTLYRWMSKHPISEYPCIELKASEVFDWFPVGRWDLSNPKLEAWAEAHKAELAI